MKDVSSWWSKYSDSTIEQLKRKEISFSEVGINSNTFGWSKLCELLDSSDNESQARKNNLELICDLANQLEYKKYLIDSDEHWIDNFILVEDSISWTWFSFQIQEYVVVTLSGENLPTSWIVRKDRHCRGCVHKIWILCGYNLIEGYVQRFVVTSSNRVN